MDQTRTSKWLKLLLFSTIIHSTQGRPENLVSPDKQTVETIPPLENPNKNSLDSVIKLQIILNEQKIIPYLREEIYRNYEVYNLTTEDLIDLWKLREYKMKDLSKMISIPDILMNFNTLRMVLGLANLTFNDYFNEIKKNVNSDQLQQAFKILNINASELAYSMSFGTEDRVYDILNEGSYSWEKFDDINNQTSWDIPTKAKDLILDRFINRSISSIAMDLQNLPLMNKATYENIWDVTNLNISDIYRVINIRTIVDNIYKNVTKDTILGVAVSKHEIIIHEKSMQNIRDYMNIISISGESSGAHHIFGKFILAGGPSKNTFRLWTNETIADIVSFIEGIENITSTNCSYIDNDIIERNVTVLNVTQNYTAITFDESVVFNIGNPVLCDGKLLGLAVEKMKKGDVVLLDTLFESMDVRNGCAKIFSINNLFIILMIILFTKYNY